MQLLAAVIRMEWAAAALGIILIYPVTGQGWWLFAALALAPDLFMLGYLAGPRIGAIAYNLVHVTIVPLALGVAGFWAASPILTAIALIWLFHIAVDRALGYGLKLPTGFQDTHLGRIGRD